MILRLRYSFIIFLTLISLFANAQSSKDSLRNIYIERFPDHFFIWPLIKQRTTQFEIQQINNSGNKLTYKPNNSVGLGFGLYVFEIGAEITFAVPVNAERESLFGKTKATDLQLNLLGKTWGLDLFYQNYDGFYINDPNGTIVPGAPYPQRPDLQTRNLGINGLYSFNKNFSLRSAYNFSERQRRSAGSFILTGTLNFYNLKGDSAVYGKNYYSQFGAATAFTKLEMNTFSVSPGYTYTVVVKNFFINGALSIGPALHWMDYQVAGKDFGGSLLNGFVDLRLGIGYNGKRFFTGVNFVIQSRSAKFEGIQFVNSSNTFKLLFGYRFKEFGILKKKAADLLPIIGIQK
jgi:Domain of unknown function (DUF4421)